MSSLRSRKILDLVQNEDNINPPYEENDQANTAYFEQPSKIISTESINVQMLRDVRNKPENRQYLNLAEYFKDTAENGSPPKLADQIVHDVENEPKDAESCKRTPLNYRISPINPEESDTDLSDGDPTFKIQEDKRVNNLLFPPIHRSSSSSSSSTSSSSSSSSDSSSDESVEEHNATNKENRTPEPSRSLQQGQELTSAAVTTTVAAVSMTKGRKRTRQPENWKQIKAKKLRNSGKRYINSKNAIIEARQLKPPCNDKCKLRCSSKINFVQRQRIFDTYWEIGDIHNQRYFILSCLTNVIPRYKYTNALAPRNCNKAFHFIVDGNSIRVCKTFFLNTLSISDRMIRTIKSKTDEHGILKADFRGMTSSHVSDEVLISDIKEFINSIPRTDSHYTRQTSTREFIDGGKTIVDLFKDFEDIQKQKNKPAGKYCTFYKVFTTNFNISFFRPRKDQCDLCLQFQNSSAEEKLAIQEKYDRHLEEKALSRQEKFNDRCKIDNNNKVILFDLQAVLQTPKGDTSAFYYKSKLNSYNFTIASLNKKVKDKIHNSYNKVECYFWNETDAKRGANEIGSCLLNYFEKLCSESRVTTDECIDLILYSDNCGGQNKNKFIVTAYLYAVTYLNIKSITHKYLIKGHTQNEADNIHSLIEKEIKKNLKSGPIYSPHQYISIIKNSRKSGCKFVVNECTFNDFYDLKKLQEGWGYNFNKTKDGKNVVWSDIKIIKVKKNYPFSFFIKESYNQQDFFEVCIRNRRTKMLPLEQLTLAKAYTGKQVLSENKKKDLRELIAKKLIPNYYSDFYDSIL